MLKITQLCGIIIIIKYYSYYYSFCTEVHLYPHTNRYVINVYSYTLITREKNAHTTDKNKQ